MSVHFDLGKGSRWLHAAFYTNSRENHKVQHDFFDWEDIQAGDLIMCYNATLSKSAAPCAGSSVFRVQFSLENGSIFPSYVELDSSELFPGCQSRPACAAGVPIASPKIKVVSFYDPVDMGNGVVQVTAELEQPAAGKAKPVELDPETVLRAVYAGKQLLYVSKDKE